ncbi:MAG: tRNA preQ1(34) S-adenosylmethionine ribosyltransferase-isomerase QueA [Firmicutes bacterium]|nr:tRNA preQ1(34) S-adenosylmethionine ribosyltransferase-isomerase QueA [Bacillota bacterium]
MNVTDFDYNLPEELIAQVPSEKRDECRLMVVHMTDGRIEHKRFYDILDYLRPGDCLVLNNSKVLPARLYGVKEGTGAQVEFLLSKRLPAGSGSDGADGAGGTAVAQAGTDAAFTGNALSDRWETLVRPGRRLKVGDSVVFSGIAPDGTKSHYPDNKLLRANIVGYSDDGTRIVEFEYEGIFLERLEEIGQMPLPPYIARANNSEDKDRYQTVYSKVEGSVAAPTAGLHFTKELLGAAAEKGIRLAYVTLHVGIGTFRPVKVDKVEEHHMHFEEYFIDEEAARIINETKAAGGRIISVGTTSTRTVESAAVWDEAAGRYIVPAGSGSTGIFIYPGYKFKVIDELITNFHLPKSTLVMLVSALYDREGVLAAYNEAVRERYQFFSYGDACFFTE